MNGKLWEVVCTAYLSISYATYLPTLIPASISASIAQAIPSKRLRIFKPSGVKRTFYCCCNSCISYFSLIIAHISCFVNNYFVAISFMSNKVQ